MKKFFLSFLIMSFFSLLGALNAYAQPPVLFFSDLTSGPSTGNGDGLGSGAIITIWGTNLGASQGGSIVQIGGVTSDHVYCWGNADGSFNPGTCGGPAKLYNFYQKMQAISFSVPAGAASGANTISVTVGGATSNAIPFTVRAGRICYVKPTGTDAVGNCGFATPWKTLQFVTGGAALGGPTLQAGDIIYAMSGADQTTNGWVMYTGTYYPPPAYTIFFAVYPNNTILIKADPNNGWGITMDSTTPYPSNLGFSKFRVYTPGTGIGATKGGRIIANEVTRGATGYPTDFPTCLTNVQSGVIGGGGPPQWGDGTVALGNHVHDVGCGPPSTSQTSKEHHVFYFTNRSGSPVGANELGWNYVNNPGLYGALHTYDEGICGGYTGTFLYHDNVIVNQLAEGVGYNMSCNATTPITAPMKIYNNLFVNVGYDTLWNKGSSGGGAGHTTVISIVGGNLTGLIEIYNNTVYGFGDNVALGIYGVGGTALSIQNSLMQGCYAGTLYFENNLIADTHGSPWNFYTDNGCNHPPTKHSNNIWYSTVSGLTTPSWDTSPITTNPSLMSPIAGDTNNLVVGGNYQLQNSSLAKNNGTNVYPTVIYDVLGISRSLPGRNYDIGVYQYITQIIPMPPSALIVK